MYRRPAKTKTEREALTKLITETRAFRLGETVSYRSHVGVVVYLGDKKIGIDRTDPAKWITPEERELVMKKGIRGVQSRIILRCESPDHPGRFYWISPPRRDACEHVSPLEERLKLPVPVKAKPRAVGIAAGPVPPVFGRAPMEGEKRDEEGEL